MIVADANLLAALVIESPNTSVAEDVMRVSRQWYVPLLWRSETANILIGYVRRKSISLDGAQRRWERLSQILADGERAPDFGRVLSLAAESGCTAYDCEYVAIAEVLSMPLVTFDREVLRTFPRIAVSPPTFLSRV